MIQRNLLSYKYVCMYMGEVFHSSEHVPVFLLEIVLFIYLLYGKRFL